MKLAMKELALFVVFLFCILQGSNGTDGTTDCGMMVEMNLTCTIEDIFNMPSDNGCACEDLQYYFFGGLGVIVFLLLLVLLLLIVICCLAHRNRKMRR